MGKYARQTTVSVSKSRSEVESILRRWGASQLQWSDDFEGGRAQLRFAWKHEGVTYVARFGIQLPTEAELEKRARWGGTSYGRVCKGKLETLKKQRGMVEHRELALFIKAAFVAVEAGIVPAEHLFLPFIEDVHGVTVAEAIMPKLSDLLQGSATRMLPEKSQ